MHPALQALLMAARGHVGLPPTIQHAPPAPANVAPSGVTAGGGDRTLAQQTAQMLTHAASAARDPQLKAQFSSALAALHKYLAADEKEAHQAMAGKLSPKLMARAAGR